MEDTSVSIIFRLGRKLGFKQLKFQVYTRRHETSSFISWFFMVMSDLYKAHHFLLTQVTTGPKDLFKSFPVLHERVETYDGSNNFQVIWVIRITVTMASQIVLLKNPVLILWPRCGQNVIPRNVDYGGGYFSETRFLFCETFIKGS